MRLFWIVLSLMLLVSLVPAGLLGALTVSDTRELLSRGAQELAQERVEQLSLEARHWLQTASGGPLELARIPGFMALPLETQQTHVGSVLNRRPEVTALTVFGPGGERITGLQAFAVRDIAPSEIAAHESRATALVGAQPEQLSYSEVHPSARGGASVTLAFPLGAPARGYVAAELSLAGLASLLEGQEVGNAGSAFAVDASGRFLGGAGQVPDAPLFSLADRVSVLHLAERRASDGQEMLHVGLYGEGSSQGFGAFAPIPPTRWSIVAEQPVSEAYAQVAAMERNLFAALGVAAAVALGLALLFSRSVTRPLEIFANKSLEIARGRFGVEIAELGTGELREMSQTFNYMSKQLEAYDQENARLYQSLEEGYLETIVALANSIDSKDAYTRGHSQRVGDLSREIGRELGMSERELKLLHYGGILHDVGKIGIAEHILCKQSRLTDDEMEVMREHPAIGDSIIEPVTFLASVRSAVRSHHENWDGTGYPDQTTGEDIPLIARIVACADTFDACTSTRPYQKAMPLEQAWGILENLKGTRLDPKVVDALRRLLESKGARVEGRRRPVRLAS